MYLGRDTIDTLDDLMHAPCHNFCSPLWSVGRSFDDQRPARGVGSPHAGGRHEQERGVGGAAGAGRPRFSGGQPVRHQRGEASWKTSSSSERRFFFFSNV